MCKEVIIIGAGGHGKVIADIILNLGDKVIGFLDDNPESDGLIGIPILGNLDICEKYKDKMFIIAIGNNYIRKKVAEKYPNLNYYTAVHPSATISSYAKINDGSCVMANAVINSSANIGKHCIINTASVIEHDTVVDDFVHVSPNATVCGTVNIGTCTHIGAGATIRNNINICENCIVGVSAAVTKNISISGVYIGIPARKIS